MLCQNQNIGDPHGCLEGKYKPFGKKSFLAVKEKTEPFRANRDADVKLLPDNLWLFSA